MMKTNIEFKRPSHIYLLKALGPGTVFMWVTNAGPELWMVTTAAAPYDDQVMCVNLQTGKMCDFDKELTVRPDFNAKVSAEFES